MAGDITREGERLVKAWLSAQSEAVRCKARLNSAECAEINAHDALAKWLLPDDAKSGEKIAVWEGDSLIQVELLEAGFPPKAKVTIRSRGKSLSTI